MVSPVQDVFQSMIVEKGESYSVLARVNSVLLARDYFLQFPILGLGWGSVTSHDLVFKLLSNTGIVGLSVFSLFVATILARLWRSARSGRLGDSKMLWSIGILMSLLTLILTSIAGDFAFTYGHVWFVFGLAMSVPVLNQTSNAGKQDFNPQRGATQ
jgi:O-antigen ligase